MQRVCINEEEMSRLNKLPLARAYVPIQSYSAPVSIEKGLEMGTVWQELYEPYIRGGNKK